MAGPARILIVDDELFNREVLEQELELLDCETITAADGQEALDRLSADAVDAILLDIMMPELDGFEVLRRLKRDDSLRHIPVIMISALDDLASVVRCIELGADDYLPKPFDSVLLKARIGACLEKKQLHDREVVHLQQIERQLEEIERQRQRADQLLHAILPAQAVAELKVSDRLEPRRFEDVAVLFGDIVDFTFYCDLHAPEEVVSNLDHLVADCERLTAQHGLEKIKTIGDAYMATANLLEPTADPVMAAIRCAFGMTEAARRNPADWRLRVGIHVGPVMAGIVGRDKFIFDLWGDTVNVAARLSGIDKASAVYLSRDAWEHVTGRCCGQSLGPVQLKGKGEIEIYRCDGVEE